MRSVLTFIDDYALPRREKSEALIKVHYATICNTDKEIIKGYKDFQGILGHEFVGVVEEAAETNYIGRRVVGEINLGCGECENCRKGYILNKKGVSIRGSVNKRVQNACILSLKKTKTV